jgi:hypothetical protein
MRVRRADSFMLMGTFMTETGKIVGRMVLECTQTLKDQGTKVNGETTSRMVKAMKPDLKEEATEETTQKARSTARANTYMQTALNTKASGRIIKFMGSASTFGKMGRSTLASGLRTTCMALEFTFIQMGFATTDSTKRTKSKAMDSTNGLMAACTRAGGTTANNMDSVATSRKLKGRGTASGSTESA